MRLEPYIVGEVVRMRPYGRGETLFVTMPSGMELKIPSAGSSIDLWLAEPGRWVTQWEKGDVEELEVVVAPVIEEEPGDEEAVSTVPLPASRLSSGIA